MRRRPGRYVPAGGLRTGSQSLSAPQGDLKRAHPERAVVGPAVSGAPLAANPERDELSAMLLPPGRRPEPRCAEHEPSAAPKGALQAGGKTLAGGPQWPGDLPGRRVQQRIALARYAGKLRPRAGNRRFGRVRPRALLFCLAAGERGAPRRLGRAEGGRIPLALCLLAPANLTGLVFGPGLSRRGIARPGLAHLVNTHGPAPAGRAAIADPLGGKLKPIAFL